MYNLNVGIILQHTYQIVTLYALNLHNIIRQSYLKAGRKKTNLKNSQPNITYRGMVKIKADFRNKGVLKENGIRSLKHRKKK